MYAVAPSHHEKLMEASHNLETVIRRVNSIESGMCTYTHLEMYVLEVINTCEKRSEKISQVNDIVKRIRSQRKYQRKTYNIYNNTNNSNVTYKDLCDLNREIKYCINTAERLYCKWEQFCKYAYNIENIVYTYISENNNNNISENNNICISENNNNIPENNNIYNNSIYNNNNSINSTYNISSKEDILNNIYIYNTYSSFLTIHIICFIILLYICISTYWGVFNIKLSGLYGIYKNNTTDCGSLVFCGTFMTRLAAPLCYHFLHIIRVSYIYTYTDNNNTHISDNIYTTFEIFYGNIYAMPGVGKYFNIYFPILIGMLYISNLVGVYRYIIKFLKLDICEFDIYTYNNSEDILNNLNLITEGQNLIRSQSNNIYTYNNSVRNIHISKLYLNNKNINKNLKKNNQNNVSVELPIVKTTQALISDNV